MPSLRKKVTSYFRQLSFYNDPRERRQNINENTFINKYLQGEISVKEGPPILYGKNPTDLPNYDLGVYNIGADTITSSYSGPNGGLTTVTRLEKHLSIPDSDIDFIDTPEDTEVPVKSPVLEKSPLLNKQVDNMTMLIKVAGQEYLVTNRKKDDTTKSHSLGSLSDVDVEIEKTKIFTNNNSDEVKCKNQEVTSDNQNGLSENQNVSQKVAFENDNFDKKSTNSQNSGISNYGLSKSKSEGNPFHHKKKGKIVRISSRPTAHADDAHINLDALDDDLKLPRFWNRKCEYAYGISDSLYDRNQVTKSKNGDPIADCFGIIARKDSAILAVADGVNWGERASVAAKSAIHGSLHYLNKTIFNDTKVFDALSTKTDMIAQKSFTMYNKNRINNTREVFVCLLRAFNCAHDLILENNGMLTTLTVAVVLPLKPKNVKTTTKERGDSLTRRAPQGSKKPNETMESYVCCVCNVGDTLAYVYSPKYGVRELTKGSHDINSNRDMRDALGALGPVDGINPELSNLTLSITVVQKGDIIMIASDGLTDNFDPNVCKFTVNTKDPLKPKQTTNKENDKPSCSRETSEIPVKPPRKNKDAKPSVTTEDQVDYDNPLVAQFMRENSLDDKNNSEAAVAEMAKPTSSQSHSKAQPSKAHTTKNIPVQIANHKSLPNRAGFLRSKTSLDMRQTTKTILRNEDGIPYITPLQRYEISLLLMEDILKHGISGNELQCKTAKKLCENLVNFTFSISSAKRHTLEDPDLYFDNVNGVLVEVSQQEKKARRRKGLERVQNLPGKLDHVSIVAYNVGYFSHAY